MAKPVEEPKRMMYCFNCRAMTPHKEAAAGPGYECTVCGK